MRRIRGQARLLATVGGVAACLAAVLASAGAAQAATNSIVPPQSEVIEALVVANNPAKPLTFGLESPRSLPVCSNCKPGDQANLSSYAGGSQLVFFIAST